MRFTFSSNPIDRLSCWFENEILSPISRYYYTHKKKHYKCCICGRITSPYFEDDCKWSLTHDMGWHKFDDGRWSRWVCHHCADHGFISVFENNNDYTWDGWQRVVKEDNTKVLATIKNKDPEYYDYWFNGGRERELFGDINDE